MKLEGPELILSLDWIVRFPGVRAIHRGVERAPLVALAIVALAFIIGFAAGPLIRHWAAGLGPSLSLDLADTPPPVEPLILKAVSRETAKRVNDATPFTTKAVEAAPPFLFFGPADDMARATDCLAATIFYEAGAERVEGQMAVVQVVLNRVRHPGYPKTVCGVVFQGHERRTGCQFSYTCDGSMRRQPSAAAWDKFRLLARAMLNGTVYRPVGLATHYHTDWVLPAWSARLEKVRAEGTHLFFRYAGRWGTAKAFRAHVAATEAQFAKMALLSPAHRTAETDLDTVLADLQKAPEALAEGGSIAIPENVSATIAPEDKSKDTFIIYVDPLLEPDSLSRMAERACGDRNYCKVLAWSDQALMPRGLPIEPGERSSMTFTYVRSKKGSAAARWNCAVFPRDSKRDCLPGSAGGRLAAENTRELSRP